MENQAFEMYSLFLNEQENLKEKHKQELRQKRIDFEDNIKYQIKKLLGKKLGEADASKIFNGCYFWHNSPYPYCQTIIFTNASIYLTNSNKDKFDLFEEKISAFNLIRLLEFILYSKVTIKPTRQ